MSPSLRHLEPGRPAREGQLILERRFRIASSILGPAGNWGRLLDIGCGNAAQTSRFIAVASRVVGLDIVPLGRAEGARCPDELLFVRAQALRLPFRAGVFDVVTAFEVLEHLSDDAAALAEISRVLCSGGTFLFTVPNKWWPLETHGAVVPGLNWVPWNRVPLVSWLPAALHDRFARARLYTMRRAVELVRRQQMVPLSRGYVTAPLDVLPDGVIRDVLRRTIFHRDITRNPLLAVNLFVAARKR